MRKRCKYSNEGIRALTPSIFKGVNTETRLGYILYSDVNRTLVIWDKLKTPMGLGYKPF